MTTMGFSSQVTVHMPSSAWNTIIASASADTRARSALDQRSAATSSSASPPKASTLASTCSPCMYRGMPSATSTIEATTWLTPRRRRRAARIASSRISMLSEPARKRCTCSRQALCVSSGRMCAAAWSRISAGACGQAMRP